MSLQFRTHALNSFSRRAHGDDFEINYIAPVCYPLFEQREILSLHDLPAGFETQINPTGDVFQALRHHSTLLSEASINFGRAGFFETLYDHVKHGSSVVAGV